MKSNTAITRRSFGRIAVSGLLVSRLGAVLASDPTSYRILVGFSAGGGADSAARLMAASMGTIASRQAVVENRAGAGGRIAIMAVKASPPDGKTLFFGSTSVLTLFPHVFTDLAYSLERDFTPVSTVCGFQYAIVVSSMIGVTDLKELAEWLKKNPSKAFFGTPGAGTPQHLIGSLFSGLTGAPLTHVPFKSGAEATQQLLGGAIPVALATAPQFIALHRAGRVRMIATTGKQRGTTMSDVPTCLESGFPDIEFEDSFGFIGPASLSGGTAASLHEVIGQAIRSPAVQQGLVGQDFEPMQIQGAAYSRYLASEKARWAATVKAVNFSPTAG
jgi:tripartite-type tricarboxylate transporter receptor subunit TctC